MLCYQQVDGPTRLYYVLDTQSATPHEWWAINIFNYIAWFNGVEDRLAPNVRIDVEEEKEKSMSLHTSYISLDE